MAAAPAPIREPDGGRRIELGIVIEARAGPAGTQLLDELLARIRIQVVPVDADLADEAMVCWRRLGLNFGDTFAYALSHRLGQPLLFVGTDFAQTDVSRRSLHRPPSDG